MTMTTLMMINVKNSQKVVAMLLLTCAFGYIQWRLILIAS